MTPKTGVSLFLRAVIGSAEAIEPASGVAHVGKGLGEAQSFGNLGVPALGEGVIHWFLWVPRRVAAEAAAEAAPTRDEDMLCQRLPAGMGQSCPSVLGVSQLVSHCLHARCQWYWILGKKRVQVSPLRVSEQTSALSSLSCRFCCNLGLNVILSLHLHSLLTTPTCPAKKLRLVQDTHHSNADI